MMNLRLRRREVAVGDVDRDALLALGAQAVGQQRQVDLAVAAPLAGPLDRRELVLEDALRVVQQPADERALAVVDRAGGGEAQQVHLEVALALAVFHRRLAEGVVGPGRAALGDPRRGDLEDDVLRRSPRSSRPRRCRSCRRPSGSARPCARPARPVRWAGSRSSTATSRRAGRRRARGRSRSTAPRCPRARCTARRPSRSSCEIGKTRMCWPLRMRPL